MGMAAYGEALRGRAWTDERVDVLKKLWTEGLSASQIAGRLGGVTRNSVISKLHRMGCAQRAVTSRIAESKSRARRRPAKPRIVAESTAPKAIKQTAKFQPPADLIGVEELVIPAHERKSLADLEACHCRWPIGDPTHANFHFCGKKRPRSDLPYCEFHCAKAFSARTGPSKPVIDTGWNHKHVQIVHDSKVA